jgi:hypothetical protein
VITEEFNNDGRTLANSSKKSLSNFRLVSKARSPASYRLTLFTPSLVITTVKGVMPHKRQNRWTLPKMSSKSAFYFESVNHEVRLDIGKKVILSLLEFLDFVLKGSYVEGFGS